MASISSSVLILGIVMASAIAQEIKEFNNLTTAEMYTATPFSTAFLTSMTADTGTHNSTITSSATQMNGNKISTKDRTTTEFSTSPKPMTPSPADLTTKSKGGTTVKPKSSTGGDNIGIIIVVVIIIAAIVFALACYFTRKRGRRYSVDFASRPDEVNVPLSAIDPDVPAGVAPQNGISNIGLQTFESADTNTKAVEEPEAAPVGKEEEKAEDDKAVAEAAAPPSPPDGSGDAAKEDISEKIPTPAEENLEEKTDDKNAVSNKTPVESKNAVQD